MSDPASAPMNLISQATEILAAHGVYALTVIFIFYQQRRALDAMKNSCPEDHAYFRRVYTSVVVATYALMVLSTGIWFYANFVYSQRSYIKGTLMGLKEQQIPPSSDKDEPEILQEIAPASDVELYVDKRFTNASALDGRYDLCWVLFPKEKVTSLAFRFQQHYEVWHTPKPGANPFEDHRFSQKEAKTIPGLFNLDLGSIHYSAGHSIQLMYEPDSGDSVKKIGVMYLLLEGKRVPLHWQDVTSESMPQAGVDSATSRISSLFRELKVYAAGGSEKELFRKNGDYDPAFATVLRERLGGTNLRLQLDAVDLLVQQGNRSFKFIGDSLVNQKPSNYDDGLLKHNLAAVVDKLESQGVHAPGKISLQLAMVFYTDQDYKDAAKFFERAGDEPIDDNTLFYRAYARYRSGDGQQSVRDYEQYLKTPHKKEYDAVGHDGLANALMQLGKDKEAVEHYNKAIQLNPKYGPAYNNLAYLYAERGQNLAVALHLVDTALQLETDEDSIAECKDTKGWILFKSGKAAEALPLIREAAAKAQDDPDIQSHLKIVEEAAASKTK